MADDDLLPQDDAGDEPDDEALVSEQQTVDASDRQTQRKARERALRELAEIELFWKSTLSSAIGRREIWKIVNDQYHAFTPVFAATQPNGFPDHDATMYHRGIQDIGLRIYHQLLAVDPQGTLLMHQENDVRFAKPAIRKRKRRGDG